MTWKANVVLAALIAAGCSPALVSLPNCPSCAPIKPEAPASQPSALPAFPDLPKAEHITWCPPENLDCDGTAKAPDPEWTCYDHSNYEALKLRVSLILCDDCRLRRNAMSEGHPGTLPKECETKPECVN